jgi:uncharacterized protein YbbK (DUF523 family)
VKLLVSACLLGVNCKYNGGNNLDSILTDKLKEFDIIPICPEQLGGLSTPRIPAEIVDGDGSHVLKGNAKVINKCGDDVTKEFVAGAKEVLKLAKQFNCDGAILKSRSPSCGCGEIYDGSFSDKLCIGNGVCSQLLMDNQIAVYNEHNYKDMHFKKFISL